MTHIKFLSVLLFTAFAVQAAVSRAYSSSSSPASQDYAALSEYVAECNREELDIPDNLSCADGEELPVWQTLKNNRKVQVTLENYDQLSKSVGISCDSPALVQRGNPQTECIPGARVQIIRKPKAENFCVMICRKTDLSLPHNEFQDIGLICHNPKSGSTCFFNSKVAVLHPNEPAKKFSYPEKNIPGPASRNNSMWMEPKVLDTAARCVSCHDADPFIISPNLGAFGKKFRERTNSSVDDPYKIVGTKKPFINQEWKERLFLNESIQCTSCHRIATSVDGGCGYLRDEALGHSASLFHSRIAKQPWMPPGHEELDAKDVERLHDCCNQHLSGIAPSNGQCQWSPIK